MIRPRAADDFPTIRARLEELRRERDQVRTAGNDLLSDRPADRSRTARWTGDISAGPGRVRQTGRLPN